MDCLDVGDETMSFWVTFQISVRQVLCDVAAFERYNVIGLQNERLNSKWKMT